MAHKWRKPGQSVESAFWSRVEKTDGCWHWHGSFHKDGYATFSPTHNSTVLGHRFTYELFVGPISPGTHIHHLCENPGCVNPAHLKMLTASEHLRLHLPKMRPKRTHCSRGHPLTPENTDERRICQICHRQRERDRYHRKKAERLGLADPVTRPPSTGP